MKGGVIVRYKAKWPGAKDHTALLCNYARRPELREYACIILSIYVHGQRVTYIPQMQETHACGLKLCFIRTWVSRAEKRDLTQPWMISQTFLNGNKKKKYSISLVFSFFFFFGFIGEGYLLIFLLFILPYMLNFDIYLIFKILFASMRKLNTRWKIYKISKVNMVENKSNFLHFYQ